MSVLRDACAPRSAYAGRSPTRLCLDWRFYFRTRSRKMPFSFTHLHVLRTILMKIRNAARLGLISAAVILLSIVRELSAESNWPRWRGPRGDGHSTETNL